MHRHRRQVKLSVLAKGLFCISQAGNMRLPALDSSRRKRYGMSQRLLQCYTSHPRKLLKP